MSLNQDNPRLHVHVDLPDVVQENSVTVVEVQDHSNRRLLEEILVTLQAILEEVRQQPTL